MVLEANWATLAPKLRGKVHVYMGDLDTFYLDGAAKLLRDSLARLGSDAVVEIFPGKDHSTLMDAKMMQRLHREMSEQFQSTPKAPQ
jgi:dienelactone hydrolase